MSAFVEFVDIRDYMSGEKAHLIAEISCENLNNILFW